MKCICEFPCPEKTNYSVFKQQFNFDMLRPKTRAERKQLQQLVVSAFELNYGYILSFLSQAEQRTVKLISRGIYYISITSEIWTGMRLQVLDKKMELFQDIDFRQEQPKVVSKQEKQIRIHSLKKNTVTTKLRQASGMKEKKMAINTINQQLPFRNTQIGFKRLLKTNISIKPSIKSTKQLSNSLLDLVEIPKQWSSSDLIVDVKDPWSKNVHRVNNVCAIVKKWNEFHHRVTTEMKEAQSDLSGLIKKCIRVDVSLSNYLKTFESEPYLSVKQYLGGAQQQLLIDQQLNKLGKAFLLNHSQLILIAQYLQQFISSAHEVCSKLGKLRTQGQSTWIIDGLSILQQLTQTWAKISNSCPDLIRIMSKSLLQILDSLLQSFSSTPLQIAEDCISLFEISINHLSKRPDFFQVLFESYGSIITALSKVCEAGEQENMGLKLTAGKFKNLKLISHNLWSISKYFSKLVKQLEAKEKKGAAGNKSNMIKQFLQSYQNLKTPYCLLDWKNPNRSEKEVQQLKQNVGKLKSQMQNQ